VPRAGRFVASVIQADDAEQDEDKHTGSKEQTCVSQPGLPLPLTSFDRQAQ